MIIICQKETFPCVQELPLASKKRPPSEWCVWLAGSTHCIVPDSPGITCACFSRTVALWKTFSETQTHQGCTLVSFSLCSEIFKAKDFSRSRKLRAHTFEICFPDWAIQNLQKACAISTTSSPVLLLLLFWGSYSGWGMAVMLRDRPQHSQQFNLKPSYSQPLMY